MHFFGFVENQFGFGILFDWIRAVVTVFVGATCWKTVWVIQGEGDFFGTFVNDESIVGNASLFFGVECTKTLIVRTIVRTPRMRDSPAFVFGSEKTG